MTFGSSGAYASGAYALYNSGHTTFTKYTQVAIFKCICDNLNASSTHVAYSGP